MVAISVLARLDSRKYRKGKKKKPLKIPALLSRSLPAFVLSVLAIYKPKPEM